METINKNDTKAVALTRTGRVFARLHSAPRPVRYVAAVLLSVLSLFGLSGTAFATTAPDPTGGIFSTAQSDLTTLIIPAAAGLVIVGIVFAVAVKWMSKGMKKG